MRQLFLLSLLSINLQATATINDSNKRFYKSGDQIVVIGAGVTGLAIVRSLLEEGVDPSNVTVIEKGDSAGGKVDSISYDGRTFEVGAQMIVPGLYGAIEDLVQRHGLTTRPLGSPSNFNLETGKMTTARDIGQIVGPVALQLAKYSSLYELYWKQVSGPKGFDDIPAALQVSWPEFVNNNGLQDLNRILATFLGGSGFLRPDAPPVAAQVVRALTPYALLSNQLHGIRVFNEGGYQKLWQLEAQEFASRGVRFLMNSEVRKIHRGSEVTTIELTSQPEVLKTEHVFFTGNPHYLPQLLDDASAAETELWHRVMTYDYRAYLVRAKGLPNEGRSGSVGIIPSMYNVPMNRPVLAVKPYADSDISIYYVYGAGPGADSEIIANIKEDLAKMGAQDVEVLTSKTWEYFPHVTSDLQGFFNGVMALQGKGGLWLAGESTSFTMTIQVYEQGRDFARMFVHREL